MVDPRLLFPLALGAIGIVLVVSGLATRRWPGLIAGFDATRCSDVDGLTRWVGRGCVILGGLCVTAALAAFALPDHRAAISVVLAAGLAVGTFVVSAGCSRFTRR